MISKEVHTAINKHFLQTSAFVVHNIYCFKCTNNETDVLIINRNGYILDCEVKVSRSDFFADFKKKRHKIFTGETPCDHYANKFFYVVPENLISVEEVPDYAGLLYVTKHGNIRKIKEAKFLHKNKVDLHEILANKFYYSYLELRNYKENNGVDYLKKQISGKEKQLTEKDTQIQLLRREIMEMRSELRKK